MDAPNINPLVYPAICFTNQIPHIIQKLLPKLAQEEIICHDPLGKCQLSLHRLEIKFDIKLLEEICNGVLVLILLRLNDFDDLAYRVAYACTCPTSSGGLAGQNGCCGKVAKNPWARCLDRVEVDGREEGLQEEGAAFQMVEVYKEGPVDMPCTRMELCESCWFCRSKEGGRGVRVDDILECV